MSLPDKLGGEIDYLLSVQYLVRHMQSAGQDTLRITRTALPVEQYQYQQCLVLDCIQSSTKPKENSLNQLSCFLLSRIAELLYVRKS